MMERFRSVRSQWT